MQLPPLSLVHDAGKWWRFREGVGWREQTDDEVKNEVWKFTWNVVSANVATGTPESVTDYLVKDVLGCVKAVLSIQRQDVDAMDATVFLRFSEGDLSVEAADGYVATQTHHIHVPTVAVAMCRGEEIPESAIRPADSTLFTPGIIPCEFDPQATCPRWLEFVEKSCPHDAEMLQKMFGLALTFNRGYNVFFTIFGEAGTGKSTALDVLATLCTGTTCAISLSDFAKTFRTYNLTVKKLNLVQDMSSVFEGDRYVSEREGLLKSCTAGEVKEVELKYVNPCSRRFRSLLVFGTNSLPRFADRSNAIKDRMRVISFPVVSRGTEWQDIHLAARLREELPGILNWSLRGYGELLESGAAKFPETEYSSALKCDAIKDSRPEELFCDEFLEKTGDANMFLPTMQVYKEFEQYCIQRRLHVPSAKRVIPEILRYRQVEKGRKSLNGATPMCFLGIRFKNDEPLPSGRSPVPALPPVGGW